VIFNYPVDFFLAMLANFLFFFSFQLLLTPLPIYVERIGGEPAQVGLVMGALALAAIFSRPGMGRVVDRLGRKPALLFGSATFAVAPLLYLSARSVPQLVAVRLFHGLGLGAFTTAYIALIADLAPSGRRGEAMGLAATASPLSLMIAPPLGTSLMESQGFAPLFAVAASAAALSLAAGLPIAEPQADRSPASDGGFFQVVRRRGVWVPSVAAGVVALTYGSVITFLPLFAARRGIEGVGFFFTAYALAIIAVQALAGRLSDRVGRRMVAVPAMICIGLAFFALAHAHSTPWLAAVGIAYGLGFGGARTTLDALIADSVPLTLRGTAMGIDYASFDLGIGLGSFLLGLVAEAWGYGSMYGLVGAICLAGAATLFVLTARPG